MVRTLPTSVVLVAALTLSGCGGGDDDDTRADDATSAASDDQAGGDSDDDAGDDAGNDASDAGSGDSSNGGAAADLGDFPIPAPPNSELVFTNELEDITAHTVTVPIGDFESAIAFYDDWTSSESDDYQRVVAESGGVIWTRTTGSVDSARNILLSAPSEGDDVIMIGLTDDPPG